MSAYNPGDIIVSELNIKSVDFKRSFITLDVYESILTPGIVVKIMLLDPEDFIGEGKIAGGETVNLSFKSPGSSTAEYKLVINTIEKVQSTQSMKAKSYLLTCCSEEVHKARDKFISKSYEKKPLSDMVKNIFEEFIGSSKKLDIEETKGLHNFIVPKLKPLHAIDAIRRRSISEQNKSSSFVFFENQDQFSQLIPFSLGEVVLLALTKDRQQIERNPTVVKVVDHSNPTTLAFTTSRPAELSNTARALQ